MKKIGINEWERICKMLVRDAGINTYKMKITDNKASASFSNRTCVSNSEFRTSPNIMVFFNTDEKDHATTGWECNKFLVSIRATDSDVEKIVSIAHELKHIYQIYHHSDNSEAEPRKFELRGYWTALQVGLLSLSEYKKTIALYY